MILLEIDVRDGNYKEDRQELSIEVETSIRGDFKSILGDLNWKMEGKRGLPPGRSQIPRIDVWG